MQHDNGDIKKWWVTMSEKRLTNHLTEKLKLPQPIVTSILERVRPLRNERKAKRIRKTVGWNLWAEFMAPARAEANTLRVMRAQLKKAGTTSGQRWEALTLYEAAINRMMERFKRLQRSGEVTPSQLPDWLKKQGKRPPEFDGTHWTDYVPTKDRREIEQKFIELPPPARGRAKTPFMRTIPMAQYKKRKAELIADLQQAIDQTEQAYDMTTNETDRKALNDRLYAMQRAMFEMDKHKRGDPLPNTWHKLI